MALSATVVFEVRPAGSGASDNNGGGYKSDAGTTDYSIASDGPVLALTDGYFTTGVTFKSDTGGFTAAMVGNLIYIVSGTHFTVGRYQIATRVDTNTVTLDAAPATEDTSAHKDAVFNVGGALATPGAAAAAANVDGHLIWVKSGTYTISTTTAGAAGPVKFVSAIRVKMEGYQTTRGDRGTKPVLVAAGAATYNLFEFQGNDSQVFCNLKADGDGVAGVSGFGCPADTITGALCIDCEAVDCNQASCRGFHVPTAVSCLATTCTTGFNIAVAGWKAAFCEASTCGTGFLLAANLQTCVGCLAQNCTGNGFTVSSVYGCLCVNCTADKNGGDGFECFQRSWAVNCISTSNGAWGFATGNYAAIINCAVGVGTSDAVNTSGTVEGAPILQYGTITQTDTTGSYGVFTGAADWRLNATANQGLLLHAAAKGIASQTNALDIGAVQHDGEATHLAADVVNLNAHKDEMIAANTAIKAHYPGVEDGTAAGGGGGMLRGNKQAYKQ